MPLSAWTAGGGASNGQSLAQPRRRSLWLEVSGFTIVFDADGEAAAWDSLRESEAAPTGASPLVAIGHEPATSNGAASQNHGVELVAVRVKRQQ